MTTHPRKLMFALLVCAAVGLGACSDGDSTPTPGPGSALLPVYQDYCAKRALCGEESMEHCAIAIARNNVIGVDGLRVAALLRSNKACIAAAGSCEAFSACLKPAASSYSCKGAAQVRCEGDTLVYCDSEDKDGYPLPCADLGLTCQSGACVDATPKSCEKIACDGTKIAFCHNGSTATVDCRSLSPDMTCLVPKDKGSPQCGFAEGAWECQKADEMTCSGDKLEMCVWGKKVTFDCAAISGGTCVPGPPYAGCALPK